MIETLIQPFIEFEFLRFALLACLLLSLSSAPLGLFLSYRRMSLTGDALSHAVLPGVAVGFWFFGLSIPAMTLGGLIAGTLIVVISSFTSRVTLLKEDSTLAVSYLMSLALGVLLVSLKGSPVDLLHFLFGHLLSITSDHLWQLSLSTLFILVVLYLVYEPLKIMTVDFDFARFLKIPTTLIHIIFMTLVVLNLVISFQILGTLLSVGELVIPAVTSRLIFKSFSSQVLGALILIMVSSFGGLLISFHLNWPSGPTLILVSGGFFVLALLKRWLSQGILK